MWLYIEPRSKENEMSQFCWFVSYCRLWLLTAGTPLAKTCRTSLFQSSQIIFVPLIIHWRIQTWCSQVVRRYKVRMWQSVESAVSSTEAAGILHTAMPVQPESRWGLKVVFGTIWGERWGVWWRRADLRCGVSVFFFYKHFHYCKMVEPPGGRR